MKKQILNPFIQKEDSFWDGRTNKEIVDFFQKELEKQRIETLDFCEKANKYLAENTELRKKIQELEARLDQLNGTGLFD